MALVRYACDRGLLAAGPRRVGFLTPLRWSQAGEVLTAARNGLLAAVLLGVGRAVGETMAVLMATGHSINIPTSVFDSVRALTATIAAEMGEVAQGSTHYHVLFGIGIILFLLTFLINLAATSAIFKKRRRGGLR